MAGEDGEGAVELLGEHDAGEFVRERQRRKRNAFGGAARQRLGKTFRRAAQENDFARAAVAAAAQPRGELRGSNALSRVIEQDDGGPAAESRRRSAAAESSRNSMSCISAKRPMRPA